MACLTLEPLIHRGPDYAAKIFRTIKTLARQYVDVDPIVLAGRLVRDLGRRIEWSDDQR